MQRKKRRLLYPALLLGALGYWIFIKSPSGDFPILRGEITKEVLARALEASIHQSRFPEQIEFPSAAHGKAFPVYTLEPSLQTSMERTLKQYSPDYGAFVAMDARTGKILTLASFSKRSNDIGNLALLASFPAASIFKLVTAAAAIDQNKADPSTVISFNGANHTLYKRNVIQNEITRWTRRMTLKEAFGRSVNTVFGKVGLMLKPDNLEDYAHRFQFNQTISVDLPLQPGTFILNPENQFNIAEAASGYSRLAMMSPLQGAMMASAIVNEGTMMEPYVIESLKDEYHEVIYRAVEKPVAVVVSKASARQLRELMRETVQSGTSRRTFRDFSRKNKRFQLEIGGKTGSLSGNYPKGKYDWFVGYATDGSQRIAMAALTINEDTWRVKASHLSRLFIENYFRLLNSPTLAARQIATD
jgi:penicillin-binding protein A